MSLMISNGIRFTKLWENPAPTSAFPAQDITLDLSKYDAVYIAIRHGTSSIVLVGGELNDSPANIWGNGNIGSSYSLQQRWYEVKTDKISVTDCYLVNGNPSSGNTENSWSVPVAIYGINF